MTYRTLQILQEKQYLRIEEHPETSQRRVLPLALQEVASRVDRRCSDLKRFASQILDINRFFRYPEIARSPRFSIEHCSGDEAKESFMDIHYHDWGHIYGFGDFDFYVDCVGFGYERGWINARVKKGRMASVIFTTCGDYTREVTSYEKQELRSSVLQEGLLKDQWINVFPEVNLMYLFSRADAGSHEWNMQRITSPELSRSYSELVRTSLG